MPLAHSILEMSAAVIDTPYGRIFHTGDWKLDADPVLGTPSTAKALTAIGDEGVDVLVCDSTNAFNAEASGTEGGLFDGLLAAVGAAKGRVVVTTFASNAARLATLGAGRQGDGAHACASRALARPHPRRCALGRLSQGFPADGRFRRSDAACRATR
jgi:ribonuclease J